MGGAPWVLQSHTMLRLVDGTYARVGAVGVAVEHMVTGQMVPLDLAGRDSLLALANGLPDHATLHPALERLERLGLVGRGLPAVDALAQQRLMELGQGHRWRLPRSRRVDALVTHVRNANSQRKVTFHGFGQTTCLPEVCVARCLELQRRVGPRRNVLLVGDDDLASLPLALMGHHVTVLEIDPLLCAFLTRLAQDAGTSITTVCQDVRDVLPDSLRGTQHAVLTDPMTHEPCVRAFVGRAINALRPGGSLLCAVHPSGRPMFDGVMAQYPLVPRDVLAGFSSYHDEGFQESWYRSDLHVLQRAPGPPPYGADETIALDDLIEGALAGAWHGCAVGGANPFRKPTPQVLATALARAFGVPPHVAAVGRDAVVMQVLPQGGHAVTSLDGRRGAVCTSIYPYTQERYHAWAAALREGVGLVGHNSVRREVTLLRGP